MQANATINLLSFEKVHTRVQLNDTFDQAFQYLCQSECKPFIIQNNCPIQFNDAVGWLTMVSSWGSVLNLPNLCQLTRKNTLEVLQKQIQETKSAIENEGQDNQILENVMKFFTDTMQRAVDQLQPALSLNTPIVSEENVFVPCGILENRSPDLYSIQHLKIYCDNVKSKIQSEEEPDWEYESTQWLYPTPTRRFIDIIRKFKLYTKIHHLTLEQIIQEFQNATQHDTFKPLTQTPLSNDLELIQTLTLQYNGTYSNEFFDHVANLANQEKYLNFILHPKDDTLYEQATYIIETKLATIIEKIYNYINYYNTNNEKAKQDLEKLQLDLVINHPYWKLSPTFVEILNNLENISQMSFDKFLHQLKTKYMVYERNIFTKYANDGFYEYYNSLTQNYTQILNNTMQHITTIMILDKRHIDILPISNTEYVSVYLFYILLVFLARPTSETKIMLNICLHAFGCAVIDILTDNITESVWLNNDIDTSKPGQYVNETKKKLKQFLDKFGPKRILSPEYNKAIELFVEQENLDPSYVAFFNTLFLSQQQRATHNMEGFYKFYYEQRKQQGTNNDAQNIKGFGQDTIKAIAKQVSNLVAKQPSPENKVGILYTSEILHAILTSKSCEVLFEDPAIKNQYQYFITVFADVLNSGSI